MLSVPPPLKLPETIPDLEPLTMNVVVVAVSLSILALNFTTILAVVATFSELVVGVLERMVTFAAARTSVSGSILIRDRTREKRQIIFSPTRSLAS